MTYTVMMLVCFCKQATIKTISDMLYGDTEEGLQEPDREGTQHIARRRRSSCQDLFPRIDEDTKSSVDCLLLNSDKTEILLIGPKNSTQNLLDYNLQLDGCNVTSSTVKNLGVILDSNLSFENHISNVTKSAFFHLRNISKLRNMLSVSDAEKLVHAFMTSRLDFCNALLGGCPASSINKLQIV